MSNGNSTMRRFTTFTENQCAIVDSVIENSPWLKSNVKNHKEDDTVHHDWIIILKSGEEIVAQIQQTVYLPRNKKGGFKNYHDVRLDLIASFTLTEEVHEKYHDWGYRWHTINGKKELADFCSLCVVKWGKLKKCDANILIFYVIGAPKPTYRIYDNTKLKSFYSYFVDNFDIKINHKEKEAFGSAFIPVPIGDPNLVSCEINSLAELKKIL